MLAWSTFRRWHQQTVRCPKLTAWNSLVIVGLSKHTDPLFPAFPLCSGSNTCERLLDPALAKAAGFFLAISGRCLGSCPCRPSPVNPRLELPSLAVQVRFTLHGQGSPHD